MVLAGMPQRRQPEGRHRCRGRPTAQHTGRRCGRRRTGDSAALPRSAEVRCRPAKIGTVGGPPGAIVAVEPALGSILRRALPWVGVGLAAGLAGVVGLVLTIVGAVGRRPTAAG
jgi:hypothetical protein